MKLEKLMYYDFLRRRT